MYSQIDRNKRRTTILIVLFVAVVLVLGWFIGYVYQAGPAGLLLAIGISGGMSLVSYYHGDKMALWTAQAQPVAKTDNPYLYRMVENLCITAGLAMPKVYCMLDPSINAFATGRDPAHASIAVTAGAIEKLANEELEGVIAHELSHIKNYDIRLMTVVIVLVGAISLLADWFLRGRMFRSSGRDRAGGGILMLVGVVLIILSPLIARLIQFAVSRKREFLADASGALLTRYPEGLARALEKIAADALPLQSANHATAHLFFSNPFGGGKRLTLFSTHPPVAERIAALRQMA